MLSARDRCAGDYRSFPFRYAVTFDSPQGVLHIRCGIAGQWAYRVGGGREKRILGLGDHPADGNGDGRDGVLVGQCRSHRLGTGNGGPGEAAARGAADRADPAGGGGGTADAAAAAKGQARAAGEGHAGLEPRVASSGLIPLLGP